ncbi:hypothetical protein Tco_1560718 [Tanacetum coccineum]
MLAEITVSRPVGTIKPTSRNHEIPAGTISLPRCLFPTLSYYPTLRTRALVPASPTYVPTSPYVPASPYVPPSPDYALASDDDTELLEALALPDYVPGSDTEYEPFKTNKEDPSEEDLTKAATAEAIPARLCMMVEARRWPFVLDNIGTWRYQEREPRYEIGESFSTQIHPIISEPIHRTIPLLVARLVRHDGLIEEATQKFGNGTPNDTNTSAGGVEHVARGYSYKEFLNCKPQTFNGTKGAVGLTRLFEKMQSVFCISNCIDDCQVKYASCTLLDGALTWWNSYVQAVGIDATYETSWKELIKMMTEEYCPRNKF